MRKVTVVHPDITPEEKRRRMQQVEKAVLDFWLAMRRKEEIETCTD